MCILPYYRVSVFPPLLSSEEESFRSHHQLGFQPRQAGPRGHRLSPPRRNQIRTQARRWSWGAPVPGQVQSGAVPPSAVCGDQLCKRRTEFPRDPLRELQLPVHLTLHSSPSTRSPRPGLLPPLPRLWGPEHLCWTHAERHSQGTVICVYKSIPLAIYLTFDS